MEHRRIHRSAVRRRLTVAIAALMLAGIGSAQGQQAMHQQQTSDPGISPDATGTVQTASPGRTIDTSNPFFKSFGPNGRTCESCHQQAQGWTITPGELTQRFNKTKGMDPVFALVDGSNKPNADVSTLSARRAAYSMLLNHGVIRVSMPVPANAEFKLVAVDDPYHYANASDMSLFRRPLPSTNLIWLTAVMWDGRETVSPFLAPMDAGADRQDINLSLAAQARDAILGHEQAATAPDDATILKMVDFESHLFTAQLSDDDAGQLNHGDGMGGANILAQQSFWVGINDTLGNDPTGEPFDESAMRMFDGWDTQDNANSHDSKDRARASIARGEKLFDTLPINISGVRGLNDVTGIPVIHGTCTTCHNSPNIGNHSVKLPIDIGLTDASRRAPDMPLYTLQNIATGQRIQTTDPGLAMRTGKWADIGKFKGAILRGLASRAPYFHNGFAATLPDVVEFYRTRFNIAITSQQKKDLANFLGAL